MCLAGSLIELAGEWNITAHSSHDEGGPLYDAEVTVRCPSECMTPNSSHDSHVVT